MKKIISLLMLLVSNNVYCSSTPTRRSSELRRFVEIPYALCASLPSDKILDVRTGYDKKLRALCPCCNTWYLAKNIISHVGRKHPDATNFHNVLAVLQNAGYIPHSAKEAKALIQQHESAQ